MRCFPGQIIDCDDPYEIEFETVEPDVLDIIRVANGIGDPRDAEPYVRYRITR